MNALPRIAIIIVIHNSYLHTFKCLSTLKDIEYPNYDIIVVDNASIDNSATQIREAFPEIILLENNANEGFARGCNRGIRYALQHDARYVWLLNNDTKPDPQALTALVEHAEAHPEAGAVGSVVYHMQDPTRIHAWGGGWVNAWLGHAGHVTEPVPAGTLHYLTAASLLVRRAALEDVGLLDEQYFMYWEDTDLCFRMRKQGWKLCVAPGSRVWHHVSASIGNDQVTIDTVFINSFVTFFKRHARWPFLPLTLGIGLRLLKRIILGDWDRVRAVWRASRHAIGPRALDALIQQRHKPPRSE